MTDPFGAAIKDFFEKGKAPDIEINSNYTEGESMPAAYLFRDEKQLPVLEKEALKKCKGKILDVGAAAGCHSLILQKKGYNVSALEISELSAEIMKQRGLVKVIHSDIFEYTGNQFNTILLLMNGAGIGKTVNGLKKLFLHLKTLLAADGQILIDSSDIKYLFEEEDGSMWVDLTNDRYYGEMDYVVKYKKNKAEFNWLYIDYNLLEKVAVEMGLKCKMVAEGEHYDYLAQLTL